MANDTNTFAIERQAPNGRWDTVALADCEESAAEKATQMASTDRSMSGGPVPYRITPEPPAVFITPEQVEQHTAATEQRRQVAEQAARAILSTHEDFTGGPPTPAYPTPPAPAGPCQATITVMLRTKDHPALYVWHNGAYGAANGRELTGKLRDVLSMVAATAVLPGDWPLYSVGIPANRHQERGTL